ncbi:hypothetical protein RF11_04342 [Thelohanellus kitauei]|uniref:Uncharacterized protein n=1 Tax=Thelohanellus kitauei TaxID=669202 RepID=A0A0C2N631_THEKT|nr:hypothetical protein RF11_04342 [Thelohanellus kitauei]
MIPIQRIVVDEAFENIRFQVTDEDCNDFKVLGNKAEAIWKKSTKDSSLDALRSKPDPFVNNIPDGNTHHSSQDRTCFYHQKFGAKSKTCRFPCTLQKHLAFTNFQKCDAEFLAYLCIPLGQQTPD